MEKRCKRCGTDVSQARRVKDPSGNYYCEPCYAAAGAAGAAQNRPKPAPAPAPVPARAPAAPPTDDLDFAPLAVPKAAPKVAAGGGGGGMDDYDLAPEEKKKAEPMAACGVCKQLRPERVVQFIEGESVCNSCLAKREGKTAGQAAASRREMSPENMPSPFILFMTSAPGIGVTAVASVLFTFVAMYLLMLAGWHALSLDKIMGANTFSVTAVASSFATGYNVFMAAILLGSMLMVDKLLGGVGFGTISGVIWKSMLIVTVQTGLTILGVISEGMHYANYVIGPLVDLAGFMLLFRLDFFEAMLLSIANYVMSYIAYMGVFAWLIFHASKEEKEDPSSPPPSWHAPKVKKARPSTMPGTRSGTMPGGTTRPGTMPGGTPTEWDEEEEEDISDDMPLNSHENIDQNRMPGVLALTGTKSPQGRLRLLSRGS